MVSGSISLGYLPFFSPFPHGTSSLSVSQEYLAFPDGTGNFKGNFSGSPLLRILRVLINVPLRGSHTLRLTFPSHSCYQLLLKAVL